MVDAAQRPATGDAADKVAESCGVEGVAEAVDVGDEGQLRCRKTREVDEVASLIDLRPGSKSAPGLQPPGCTRIHLVYRRRESQL